jgi:ATP-binding cassette subfamily F protein 1
MDSFNFQLTKSNDKTNVIQASCFSIAINSKKLFENSSLSLAPNNIYGLIGKNGAGKTTLINHISHNKIPVNEKLFLLHLQQILEETEDNPVNILLQSGGPMFKYQKRANELLEIMENSEEDNIDDEIYEEYNEIEQKLATHEFNIDRETSKIKSILNGLGFSEIMMEKPFSKFSGGWKMRISLAKCLYLEPDVLLLDEPTNHLDLEAVLWLGKYLEESNKDKIILIVSHNIGFLNRVCTNILNIESLKLVNYNGNYTSFRQTLEKKFQNQVKEWTKVEKQIKKLNKKDSEKILKEKSDQGIVKPERPYEVKFEFSNEYSNTRTTHNLISFRDVDFSIGDNILFEKLNFGIDSDSRICLIGKNGIGKSSLFKLIKGDYQPTNGSVVIDISVKIGYFNQHFETFLDNDKSPVEFLESRVPDNLLTTSKMQTVRKYLGNLKLEPKFHNTKIGNLSGGQKARVAFVYLIFQQPNFLLLDEPTNHLDIETIEALIEALNNFQGGFMIITHESELLDNLDPNIWLIKNKNIIIDSNLEDILK